MRRRFRRSIIDEWIATIITLLIIALVAAVASWLFHVAMFPIFVVATLAILMKAEVERV